jgi:hypothetical protein
VAQHVLLEEGRLFDDLQEEVQVAMEGGFHIDQILESFDVEGVVEEEVVVHDEGISLGKLIQTFNRVPEVEIVDVYALVAHPMDIDEDVCADINDVAKCQGGYHRLEARLTTKQKM